MVSSLTRLLARLRSALRPRTQEERNVLCLVLEIAFQGVVAGAGGSYLSVFAARLGASTILIGLLASVPALLLTVLSIPVGQFVSRSRRLVPIVVWGGLAFQCAYLFIGLAPWLTPGFAAQTVVAVWSAAAVALAFASVAFTAVLAEATPPTRRANIITLRFAVHSLVAVVTLQVTARVLVWLPFPLNYQVLFIGTFLAAMASTLILSRVRLPEQRRVVDATGPPTPLWRRLRMAVDALRSESAFSRYLTSSTVFRLGMALPGPLYSIYWVHHLHLSDDSIALAITLNYVFSLIGFYVWGRISRRWGRAFALAASCLGLSAYPLVTGLARSFTPIIFVSMIGGFFSAGMSVSFLDVLLATAPAGQRPSYVALDATVANATAFVGPLLGSALADGLGIRVALIIGFGVRLVGGSLFALRPVRPSAGEGSRAPAASREASR